MTTRARTASIFAAAALAALFGAAPARADSIRCPGGIVTTGDLKLDLLGKCGPATLVDRQEVRHVQVTSGASAASGAPSARALGASADGIETWTYDLGPGQQLRIVTIARGRVSQVGTAGHGFTTPPERPTLRAAACDPASIDEGDTKLELLATCGEPTVRDAWEETRGVAAGVGGAGGAGEAVYVTATVELWTYDFGPNRLVRIARIEGGRVTAVESGGYGYGR